MDLFYFLSWLMMLFTSFFFFSFFLFFFYLFIYLFSTFWWLSFQAFIFCSETKGKKVFDNFKEKLIQFSVIFIFIFKTKTKNGAGTKQICDYWFPMFFFVITCWLEWWTKQKGWDEEENEKDERFHQNDYFKKLQKLVDIDE